VRSTGFADGAFSAGDSFGEELFLEGGGLCFVFAFELVVDGVHEPYVEFVAVLVSFAFEDGGLGLYELHEFAGGDCFHFFAFVHGGEEVVEVVEDAVVVAGWGAGYGEISTMLEKTGWWKSTWRTELA
jgi:hypothetical protein